MADIRQSLEHPDRLPYFQLTAARRPTLAHKFKQLRQAGVVQLIGTDSGIPMNFHSHSTWRELDAWVNVLGVDPMTAIRAATYWPSVAMKVDAEVGTVSAGKYADIIAVRGDVLRHVDLPAARRRGDQGRGEVPGSHLEACAAETPEQGHPGCREAGRKFSPPANR